MKREQLNRQEQESAKEATEELRDLLLQRDDIANANVFTRLRSREQVKFDQLSDIDKQIAQKTAELKGYLNAGIQHSDVENLKQILGQVQSVNNNSLQVFIDGATDIETGLLITFLRRFMGQRHNDILNIFYSWQLVRILLSKSSLHIPAL